MNIRRVVAAVVFLLGTTSWTSAQTLSAPPSTAIEIEEIDAGNTRTVDQQRGRPGLLVPLYVMQFTLHGLDVHSTLQALERGHREANPLLRNATSGQMIGAKLATAAASVWVAERLWKKNRPAAIILMAAVNVGLSAVVANNYRIARR